MSTQKERLLELFHLRGTLSNYELRAMNPPMFQFPVRILELRREGHNIVTERDKNDRRKYYYSLRIDDKKDLF